jgi:hypothetical protein
MRSPIIVTQDCWFYENTASIDVVVRHSLRDDGSRPTSITRIKFAKLLESPAFERYLSQRPKRKAAK